MGSSSSIENRIVSLDQLQADLRRASDLAALFLNPSDLSFVSFSCDDTGDPTKSYLPSTLPVFWRHVVTVFAHSHNIAVAGERPPPPLAPCVLSVYRFYEILQFMEQNYQTLISDQDSYLRECHRRAETRAVDPVPGSTPDPNSVRSFSSVECTICDVRTPDISLPCGHSFCRRCIAQWRLKFSDDLHPVDGEQNDDDSIRVNAAQATCPTCRFPLETDQEDWQLEDLNMGDLQQDIARIHQALQVLLTEN